jgi:hypothetical protein
MQIIRKLNQGKLRYIWPMVGPLILIVAGMVTQNTALWIVGVVLIGPGLATASRSPR